VNQDNILGVLDDIRQFLFGVLSEMKALGA